jgi:hypothetical protein
MQNVVTFIVRFVHTIYAFLLSYIKLKHNNKEQSKNGKKYILIRAKRTL